jgi:hypothetical protein
MYDATLCGIDHAGHGDPHAFASADLFVIGEHLLDTACEFLDEYVGVAIGLKTADNAELPAHQVGAKDVAARRADVDADNAALARVDVEKSRATPTADRLAHGPFEDERLAEEFVHQEADDTASDVHQSRQVSTGDRLVGADEIQGDLPVDFAAGPASSDCEIVWIDLSHLDIVL